MKKGFALFALDILLGVALLGCTKPTVTSLVGNIPDGWLPVKVPGTDVSFALPPGWQTLDVLSGTVSFSSGSDDSFVGVVTIAEEVPASRLSLLRLMDSSQSICAVTRSRMPTKNAGEGQITNPPMYWSSYQLQTQGEEVLCWQGGIITSKGTIVVSGWGKKDLFEQIAASLSCPDPPLLLNQ